jgi:hypothetical protein
MGRLAADPADLAPGSGFRISWSGSRRRTRAGAIREFAGLLATLGTRSGATRSSAPFLTKVSNRHQCAASGMPWRTFLQTHLGVIAAMDFFAVEVLTFGRLARYFVLFVIVWETGGLRSQASRASHTAPG